MPLFDQPGEEPPDRHQRPVDRTDGLALLPAQVVKTALTMTPGERYDVIIDFAGFAPGTEIILQNSAPQGWPENQGPTNIPNIM